MTFETENRQYEALSNMRTLTPIGEHEVKELDGKIKEHELCIEILQGRRREVINRYSLNKKCEGCKEDDQHSHLCD